MGFLNNIFSGYILPILLIALGLFFGIKLRFFYIFHPVKTTQAILNNQKGGFKSLSVALAGTLGVGNIVGVASAILSGGAGAVFWMWVSALCAMSLKYCEVYLAMQYRRHNGTKFYGGAPYYINDGLRPKMGKKASFLLSCAFALLCVVNSLTTGNLVQINAVSSIFPFSRLTVGIVAAICVFFVIVGGYKRISRLTSFLIPCLTFFYILICLYVIVLNFRQLPNVVEKIFFEAFSKKSIVGGFYGYGIASAIRYGVSRGVLSNEAGCGTSPSAHASSDSINAHSQSCLGIFEVFVDTILLCSLTAFVILLSPSVLSDNAMELVLNSFASFTGDFGRYSIIALSVLFAFATIVCQFFYGEEAVGYISKSKKVKTIFVFVFSLIILVGAVIPMSLMWEISDLAISLMTIFNLICLFILRKEINDKNHSP